VRNFGLGFLGVMPLWDGWKFITFSFQWRNLMQQIIPLNSICQNGGYANVYFFNVVIMDLISFVKFLILFVCLPSFFCLKLFL
jgi:hypothetical protein